MPHKNAYSIIPLVNIVLIAAAIMGTYMRNATYSDEEMNDFRKFLKTDSGAALLTLLWVAPLILHGVLLKHMFPTLMQSAA